jgi:hypothetical protein
MDLTKEAPVSIDGQLSFLILFEQIRVIGG